MPEIKGKRKQLVRKTLMRAKAQGERVADQRQESPEEYAQGEVQQGISGAVDRVNGTTQSTARMSYRKFRMMQDRRRKVDIQDSAATTLKPPEKEQVIVPTQTERRKMFKKQRFRQKAVAAKKSAPQAPALPADILAPTLPHYRAQMQRLKRQHLTREAVRLYGVFKDYIHASKFLDFVWSEKLGYLLLHIDPTKNTIEEDQIITSADELCAELFNEVAMDVFQEAKREHFYPDADDDEIAVIRRRWQPYLDLLPEYRSSCRAFHIAE